MTETLNPSADYMTKAGFKTGTNGPHSSRTLMLNEISIALESLPATAMRADYCNAIINRNILGKQTESTRKESFRRLRELYSLDPATPLFAVYRELDQFDCLARPILSLLLACARDPLLRATIPVIQGAHETDVISVSHFDDAIEKTFPGHMKPKIRAATARHIASSWEQSGHLSGRDVKIRVRVTARPAALTFALILSTLQGIHGDAIFSSVWCRLLDLNAAQSRSLAMQAHREGLIDLRAVGAVVEVTFPRFAQYLHMGDTHESL